MTAKYVLGIDLGTTNSALAYAELGQESIAVQTLAIPQLVAGSTIESRSSLASFLYLASDHDAAGGGLDVPWEGGRNFAVGEFARKQAADVPTRTVVGAKSWLAHSRVDRHQAILPWNAPEDVAKVSPVVASQRYLEHLISAWNAAFPAAPAHQQMIILTVPASFDASARELTREAAITAGLPANLVLLEEPQAAVYAWLADENDSWRRQLKLGDTLLVCDVGGGTTDFTLVNVLQDDGELVLNRMAVGNHILVGGDNMDLAIAHHVSGAFQSKGVKLDPWQSVSLWHACRTAKESLLDTSGAETHPIAVLGRSSKLIGGTVSLDLQRQVAAELLLEGFFPQCQLDDRPVKRRVSGFREIGLPYENDTAITRHLAEFLTSHGDEYGPVQPTHILFNGGVFKSPAFRNRVVDTLQSWFLDTPIRGFERNHDLDLSVARGAAYYGAAKQGRGIRIRGGTARSYYVGIETAGLAIPGVPRPMQALCVVPFGMEEGTETDVPVTEVGLVVGEQTNFRFFSSSTRKQDQPGDLIRTWTEDEIVETDSLEAELPPTASADDDGYVPVQFRSHITELGVFELWCVSTVSDDRWKLEFSVREDAV